MTCPSLPASNLYIPCVRGCRHAIGRRRWNENQLCDNLEPRAVEKPRKLLEAAAEIHIFQTDISVVPCFLHLPQSGRIEFWVGAIWHHVSCSDSFINWNWQIPRSRGVSPWGFRVDSATRRSLLPHFVNVKWIATCYKHAAVMGWIEELSRKDQGKKR